MPIESSIALGVKPMQVKSQGEYLNELYARQNAEQSNQLNQMKMDEYRRGIADTESWKQSMGGVDANTPAGQRQIYNALIRKGDVNGASNFAEKVQTTKNLSFTGDKTQGEISKQKVDLIDAKLKQAKDYLSSVTTPEQYLAWHKANHNDPILGPELAARGVTEDTSRAEIATAMATPKGFQELLQKSALGLAKFTELNKPNIQTQNLGNRSVVTAYSGLNGEGTQLSSTAIGQSPDSVASNARIKQEGVLNRAAKLKSELDSEVTDLSPESLDFTAQLYMQTGSLPPLGMGSKAASLKKQIITRAAQLSMHPETAAAVNPVAPGDTTPILPTVSAADAAGGMVQNKQNVATQVKTLKDFSTGVQGQQVASFNTALNHLDTLERLGNDLNNPDIRLVNKAANLFAKELGGAAPTSFNAAKKIVGAEIQKALIRQGGTGKEREDAAAAFDAANSPAQLAGVFKAVRELLGGQLVTLKQQYDSNVGSKAKPFESKLNSAARKQLNALTSGANPNVDVSAIDAELAKRGLN